MPYTLPSWQDTPSTATPISAANLTQANTAINSIDSRLTTVETGKVSSGLVNAQGKLISADNTGTPTAVLIGTNGQVLTADSTAATGMKWATPTSGGGSVNSVTAGDSSIVVAGTGTAPTVAINATGTPGSTTFLRGDRVWAAPAGASTPDATGSVKGIVQLAGDLAGTAASPTINATGTPSSTTFLRGDKTWAVPAGGGSGIPVSTVTAKGDLIVATGSGAVVNFPAPGLDGYVLTTDTTVTSTNTRWATPAYGLVQASGVDKPVRAALNFTGSGVTVTDSSVSTNVAIAGGSGSGYNEIFSEGGPVTPLRSWLNFKGTGVSVVDVPATSSTDVTIQGFSGPGYTTVTPNVANVFLIPSAGASFCQIVTDGSVVSVQDPPAGKGAIVHLCVQMDGVGGKRWEMSPSTIIWDTGAQAATATGQPVPFDLTAHTTTFYRLIWMGDNQGYYGEVVTSIPPLYTTFSGTWTDTGTSITGGLGGGGTQAMNTTILWMRYLPVARQPWVLDSLVQHFSAALRQRLTNNGFTLEVCNRFPTDGPRSGAYRGGDEQFGGFFFTDAAGHAGGTVLSIFGATETSKGTAHETCHGIDAAYYNGANSADPQGQVLISNHPTLVTVNNDCQTNGADGPGRSEWFAEAERIRRGGVFDTATMNAIFGSGSTGGTQASRQTRFNNYMASLGMV